MAVDDRFADRYHAAAIDPRTVPLEKRWQGVVTAVDTLDAAMLPDLARIAALRPVATISTKEAFQKPFKEGDPAFLLDNNDQELAVLAGSALSHLLAKQQRAADLGALLIQCGAFCGWSYAVSGLDTQAGQYLDARRVAVRRANAPNVATGTKAWSNLVTKTAQEATESGNAALAPHLTALAKASLADQGATESLMKAVISYADQRVNQLAEELNILWWLFDGRSTTTDATWDQVPTACVPLIAATELYDLSHWMLAPLASMAFLRRTMVGTGGSSIDIATAVDAAPPGWHDRVHSGPDYADLGDLTPIVATTRGSSTNMDASADGVRTPRSTEGIAEQWLREQQVGRIYLAMTAS